MRPRPNVWWIPIKEGEDMTSYFTRATEEAKKGNTNLCFRKGGSTCLGLRLQANKSIPQLHAWTLHGAPRHWFGQDVLQCLFDAGCSEAAIIRPPGKQKAWLVKAVVPDENSLGVMAIHAGSQVMYLNRVINKQRRSTEVMTVIRAPNIQPRAFKSAQMKLTRKRLPPSRRDLAAGLPTKSHMTLQKTIQRRLPKPNLKKMVFSPESQIESLLLIVGEQVTAVTTASRQALPWIKAKLLSTSKRCCTQEAEL